MNRNRARYPRMIKIGEKRYNVESPIQERHIIQSHLAENQKQLKMAMLREDKPAAKQLQRRVKLLATRADKLEAKDSHAKQLRQWDEEIVAIIAGL